MNESNPTRHVPGHSSRGSGTGVVVVVVDWVVTGRLGGGRGRVVVDILESSQHTDPLLQFDVFGIMTEGRSQKAAMMFRRQNPGQRGGGAYKNNSVIHCYSILTKSLVAYRSCDLGSGHLHFLIVGDTATSLIRTERIRIDVIAEEGNQSVHTVARAFVLIAWGLLVLCNSLLGRFSTLRDDVGSLGSLWWVIDFHFWCLGGSLQWSHKKSR